MQPLGFRTWCHLWPLGKQLPSGRWQALVLAAAEGRFSSPQEPGAGAAVATGTKLPGRCERAWQLPAAPAKRAHASPLAQASLQIGGRHTHLKKRSANSGLANAAAGALVSNATGRTVGTRPPYTSDRYLCGASGWSVAGAAVASSAKSQQLVEARWGITVGSQRARRPRASSPVNPPTLLPCAHGCKTPAHSRRSMPSSDSSLARYRSLSSALELNASMLPWAVRGRRRRQAWGSWFRA